MSSESTNCQKHGYHKPGSCPSCMEVLAKQESRKNGNAWFAKHIDDIENMEEELTTLRKQVEALEEQRFMSSSLDEIVSAANSERDRYRTALERIVPMIGTLRSSLKHWGIPKDAKGLCSQIKSIATDAIREGAK